MPEALVVAENEKLIFLQRPAQRGSELVAAKGRNGTLVEIIFLVQVADSKELE